MKREKVFCLLTALIVMLSALANSANAQSKDKVENQSGSIYIQTNGVANEIIHYARRADGKLIEAERISTGGAGSGTFKPITGQASAPNAFEGVGSIIITPDRQYLFTTNGGDNSVSSFKIGVDGRLTLVDVKPTGQTVSGKSGTAKSLAYAPNTQTLYVCHSFGPDHIRMFSVNNGKLTAKKGSHTINTGSKTLFLFS
jgi:6-phosphogluconolactonase (cycloisomerase 2 family)